MVFACFFLHHAQAQVPTILIPNIYQFVGPDIKKNNERKSSKLDYKLLEQIKN